MLRLQEQTARHQRPTQKQPDRFVDEPLDNSNISVEELEILHDASWPKGLAPSVDTLRRMLRQDMIFGAFDGHRLVAALHARLLHDASSIGAGDVAHARTFVEDRRFHPPCVDGGAIVCFAAVTHPEYRGGNVTQRLITEYVLPYLARDEKTKSLGWYTSSPLTYMADTGRLLASDDKLQHIVDICEYHVARLQPLGYSSLRQLIEVARPTLDLLGFELQPYPRTTVDFFDALYTALPTHQELFELRIGERFERDRARFLEERVTRLYDRREHLDASHMAAFMLVFLAASFSQSGIYHGLAPNGALAKNTGHPVDPILGFHFANGAILHWEAGPLPNSRIEDVAAFRFGQALDYRPDWAKRRSDYQQLVQLRRERCVEMEMIGVQVDMNFASRYLRNAVQRAERISLGRHAMSLAAKA